MVDELRNHIDRRWPCVEGTAEDGRTPPLALNVSDYFKWVLKGVLLFKVVKWEKHGRRHEEGHRGALLDGRFAERGRRCLAHELRHDLANVQGLVRTNLHLSKAGSLVHCLRVVRTVGLCDLFFVEVGLAIVVVKHVLKNAFARAAHNRHKHVLSLSFLELWVDRQILNRVVVFVHVDPALPALILPKTRCGTFG